ncbi:MAG: ribonuclease Z [Candidatus Lokiarchaeota archaeon]|nr:ribonuclease Z [Candidatus Lokiarchaeota archaeon]
MEVVVLGSSAAIPVKDRNLPSIALILDNGPDMILFDCGEDVQRRFIEAGLKFNRPMTILISHFHGDHVNGLPGLLFRFNLTDRTAPLTIIGPRNLFLYLFLHRLTVGLRAQYPITIIEIDHDNKKKLIYEGLDSEFPIDEIEIKENTILEAKNHVIKYTLVEHSILTFGYSFVEKPRNGKFFPEKALELGIPRNSIWKRLHEGKKIEFNDRVIDPEKEGIVGPKRPGRKITYSGDTAPCGSLIELGEGSDLLIHEATYTKELAHIAKEKKHSTTVDAATVAIKMNAKKLLLTHISSRYQDDPSVLLDEAKEVFPNSLLARDLMRIEIK